jgi:hypothetical protein
MPDHEIANRSYGADKGRLFRVIAQFLPEGADMNIDRPIEDVIIASRNVIE